MRRLTLELRNHPLGQHGPLLGFGLVMAFCSSFGQTFFISLSAPHLMDSFALSNSSWGAIYSGATLLSAACLPYFGRLLDRMPLRPFSIWLALGLGLACLTLSLCLNPLMLFLAISALRLTGQGLMGLTAMTTMARAFVARRGIALSIASMGFPLGEIIFPPLTLLLILKVGWRTQWALVAGAILLLLVPLIQYLLSKSASRPASLSTKPTDQTSQTESALPGWTLSRVFRDWRVYLLLPAYVMPGFLATGLILHQFRLAEEKDWPQTLMAGSFVTFGITRLAFSLLVGPMIDRFRAVGVFPFHLLPLIGSILILNASTNPVIPSVYYGLMGISLGLGGSSAAAMWAELYGVRYLGSIKSLMSTLAILCTAISPVMLGWLLDQGVPFNSICIPLAAGLVLFSIMSFVACQQKMKI